MLANCWLGSSAGSLSNANSISTASSGDDISVPCHTQEQQQTASHNKELIAETTELNSRDFLK